MEPADARYVEGEGKPEADRSLSSVLRGYRRFRVSFPTPRARSEVDRGADSRVSAASLRAD